MWYNKSNIYTMADSRRLTFGQFRSPMDTSAILRQDMLKARLEAGDEGLVNYSKEQRSHAVKDRYYSESAPKRALVLSRLYRQAKEEAKGAKARGLGAQATQLIAAPIQQGTSKLLQQSWLNLIDSYGLTLIWINVHVFLRWTVGEKYFCKLGREWLGGGKMGGASAAKGAGQSSNLILGLPAAGLGLLEAGVLAMLDFILLMLILASLAIPAFLIYMIINPTEAIDLIGISDLYDLVKAYLL